MQTESWTHASIKAHLTGIQDQIVGLIPIKLSPLKEAHARGLGFRTEAALAAALKASPQLPARVFDKQAFVERLAELSDEASAEAIGTMLGGAEIDISIRKYSDQRQRANEYWDVAYDVEVKIHGVPDDAIAGDVNFHLPEFGRAAGAEPYRVDSAHDRRVTPDYAKTRRDGSRQTLVAKLVDGHWRGGLFIYASEHQMDGARCVQSVRAALVRAILPQLPIAVRCFIFRPDRYDEGAWRVELRLPPSVQRFFGDSPFYFNVPKLAKRHFIFKSDYRIDVDVGRFVDGLWEADLYTNGIAEADNPTSLWVVKRELLKSVNERLDMFGYADDGAATQPA